VVKVGIVGVFAASLEGAIRRNLSIPCEIVASDEAGIVAGLADIDVLVTMVLTHEMGRASARLKLVQVPGAGLDRIERSAMPSGAWLANVHGHENGIAEYVIGAMVALTRDFVRLDAALRKDTGEANGQSGLHRLPSGPNSPAKPSGFSAMAGSVRP
jgi:phosphoglycerate dehydrogenase-like enzyme